MALLFFVVQPLIPAIMFNYQWPEFFEIPSYHITKRWLWRFLP